MLKLYYKFNFATGPSLDIVSYFCSIAGACCFKKLLTFCGILAFDLLLRYSSLLITIDFVKSIAELGLSGCSPPKLILYLLGTFCAFVLKGIQTLLLLRLKE